MAADALQSLEIIEVMENFISRMRPPEEIRNKLDMGYEIEDQSIIIFEIIPHWKKPNEIMKFAVAKTTFVKAKNHWKVFWQRADLKWHPYPATPTVKSITAFTTQLVGQDKHHCFFG